MTTVSEIAKSIANNIERFGHYQAPDTEHEDMNSLHNEKQNPYGLCCVLRNPTAAALHRAGDYDSYDAFHDALYGKIGRGVVFWSNDTPTPEVLATLRSL